MSDNILKINSLRFDGVDFSLPPNDDNLYSMKNKQWVQNSSNDFDINSISISENNFKPSYLTMKSTNDDGTIYSGAM